MSTIEEPSDRSTRNMKKRAFFTGLIAVGVLMAAALFAGSPMLNAHAQISSENSTLGQNNSLLQGPPLSANLSTVSTSGTATTKVSPDMFSVIVGVETNGTTAQEAVSRNANLTAQVIEALRGLGINENQIGTSTYSVSPIYEDSRQQPMQALPPCTEIYPPPPECEPRQRIIGYSVTNSVTVTLSVNTGINAGQVIDASIQAGANNVNGLYFFVSPDRQQEIRDSLIRDAVSSARQRANIAAEGLGMTVSGVQSVDLNEVFFPIFRGGLEQFSTAGAPENVSPPTQILPGEQEVSTTVRIVFYMNNGSSEVD
jgi:uncharacterized protein